MTQRELDAFFEAYDREATYSALWLILMMVGGIALLIVGVILLCGRQHDGLAVAASFTGVGIALYALSHDPYSAR